MKFFKPEDFPTATIWDVFNNCWSSKLNPEKAAELANAKLEREGKVVYGLGGITNFSIQKGHIDTHKALLINIEPIKEHEECE